MLINIIALIVSYIPAAALFFYLKGLKKDDEAYQKNCLKLLGKGVLSSVGVTLVSGLISLAWHLTGMDKISPLLTAAFKCFVVYAFAEELVKFLNANKTVRENQATVSWLDVMAYMSIVAIGFHIIESLLYFFSTNTIEILVRGITAGHPTYGLLMGYFMGKAGYTGQKKYRVLGLLAPIMLHGLYDFGLAEEFIALNDNLIFFVFIILLITICLFFRMIFFIRKVRHEEKYTAPLSRQQN